MTQQELDQIRTDYYEGRAKVMVIPKLLDEIERLRVKPSNYQYSEYQIRMHNAQCFCQVPDCPYCLNIARNQRDNPISWRNE